MKQCVGGYACVAMLAGFGIIAFRDPNGIRPLGMSSRPALRAEASPLPVEGHGKDYCFTSESVVSDALGFENFEDIKAGEAVIITKHAVSRRMLTPAADSPDAYPFAPDIFEYVYFARPDSVMDGVSVYRSRMAMGDKLAAEVARQLEARGEKIDVVIPVPDTSRVAALQLAQTMNVPYREGFVKNRYVGRTFIMPGQSVRRKNVRRKLNAMALEFDGKNVLLVDDSIVRGTTSKEIIQMARDAGAKKVIMASCAPPIRHSNVYGIDMPSRHELVAHGRTVEQVAQYIAADMVIYQTLEDLIDSVRQFNPDLNKFDCSVFDGNYVTGGVDDKYILRLEGLRSENAKAKKNAGRIPIPIPGLTAPASPATSEPVAVALDKPRDLANDDRLPGEPKLCRKRRLGDDGDDQEPSERQPPADMADMACSGPMNGADDIGLYNGWSR